MRWSIVGPTFPYKGGIAQHTTEMAHRLERRGHEVTIESWSEQYPKRLYPGHQKLAEQDVDAFPRVSYDLSWKRPDSWVRVGRRIARSADVVTFVMATPVQVPIYRTIVASMRRGRRDGAPTVIGVCHNVVPHEPRRFDRRLFRALAERIDGLLVHSSSEERAALERGANRVEVAGLPSFLEQDAPIAQPARLEPVGRLAFVGFVRPYKGLDVLIEALARSEATPHLEVRGEFWDPQTVYEEQILAAGLEDRVHIHAGYASNEDLVRTIDGADALVLPYRSATGTLLPRIAFQRGTPVIVTDVGDLGAQVRHGVDGLVCAPDDPASLAAAIDAIYQPGALERMRSNVRAPDVDGEWDTYLSALERAAGRSVSD